MTKLSSKAPCHFCVFEKSYYIIAIKYHLFTLGHSLYSFSDQIFLFDNQNNESQMIIKHLISSGFFVWLFWVIFGFCLDMSSQPSICGQMYYFWFLSCRHWIHRFKWIHIIFIQIFFLTIHQFWNTYSVYELHMCGK